MEIYDFGHRTLEQVVDRVSEGALQGFEDVDSEFLAASYAFDAANDNEDLSEDSMRFHLEFLIEHGAEFDVELALSKCDQLKKN